MWLFGDAGGERRALGVATISSRDEASFDRESASGNVAGVKGFKCARTVISLMQ